MVMMLPHQFVQTPNSLCETDRMHLMLKSVISELARELGWKMAFKALSCRKCFILCVEMRHL